MTERLVRPFAVVLNWNGGALNLDCLQSILDNGIAAGELVFVDNASTDGSLEQVRAAYPGLTVLVNATNVGFGHGINRGI